MSTRAQLQNTKLSQRVADFVKCTIRGELYETSNLNILVQVVSTNPFEISDLHYYIQVKDPTVFLDKIKETNENLTLQSLKGAYFNLLKWNFVASMDPNSNKLQFDIQVEEVNFLGGQDTMAYPENPTPLFETGQVKSSLNRLKKFFIAQRFNQENPFDPTPIEEARYAISESIRKQANIPREYMENSQLQDPFLIYNPPNDGKVSVSQSQMDEYEELSINSQTQRRVGDHFRNRDQVKKPYSTMPADMFGLNLETLPSQPLLGANPIPEASEREEDISASAEKLPNFGGDQPLDQNKEPEVGTDKIENEAPRKRNFDDLMAENPESAHNHAHQTTKTIKPTWGPNHHTNQNQFKQFRDEKRALESKKSDPLDLLNMTESQEAIEFQAMYHRQERREEIHRPPETRFGKPLLEEDIEIEEEINKEKPKPQSIQIKVLSPVQNEKPKAQPNSKDSKKSWSFGRSGGAVDEEIEITKHTQPQLRQSTISDFTKKTQPYIQNIQNKPAPIQRPTVQQHNITTQTVVPIQYVTKELKYPPPQHGSNKKPVYKDQTYQIQSRKSHHEVYEIEDNDYLVSFKEVKKPSPADKIFQITQKQRFEAAPVRRESGISMDYLKSFADLSKPKKSPAVKFIENPIKAGSQIDLTEFRPVSAKKQTNSSSTLIQRSPRVPSVQASPAKFSENEFEYMKQLYEQAVGK